MGNNLLRLKLKAYFSANFMTKCEHYSWDISTLTGESADAMELETILELIDKFFKEMK